MPASFAHLITEELAAADVRTIVRVSGASYLPLAAAIEKCQWFHTISHFDERAGAFCGLGFGHATGRPAAVLVTAGTAVANCFPAVLESYYHRIPLIILSADRSADQDCVEFQQWIDQRNLFGPWTRHYCEIPVSSKEISPDWVRAAINHAVRKATSPVPGPVHVNFRIRNRFKETRFIIDEVTTPETPPRTPWVAYADLKSRLPEPIQAQLVTAITNGSPGALVVARPATGREKERIRDLATALNWPVFHDCLDRMVPAGSDYEVLAALEDFRLLPAALAGRVNEFAQSRQTVIHLGATACRRARRLARTQMPHHIVVAPGEDRDDPASVGATRIPCSVEDFCDQILPLLGNEISPAPLPLPEAVTLRNRLLKYLDSAAGPGELNELTVAFHIMRASPRQAVLVGNSLTYRVFCLLAALCHDFPHALVERRGSNGIDGTVSYAAGLSLASGELVTMVCGDLTFLYDSSALAFLKKGPKAIVVAFNNHGAGLFDPKSLPNGELADCRHEYSLAGIADTYGLPYLRCTTIEQFSSGYKKFLRDNESALIEVPVPPLAGVTDRLRKALSDSLA